MLTIYVSNGRETRRADERRARVAAAEERLLRLGRSPEPDRRGSAHPRGAVRLPRAGDRGRAQGDPDPQGRELRRPPLPDPARHRLLGRAAPLRDARGRHLPRRAVPGHRARRVLAVGRAPARGLSAQRLRAGRRAGSAAAPHRRLDGRQLPARGREARGAARRDRGPRLRRARRRTTSARSSGSSATWRRCAAWSRRSATSSAGWRGASSR